MDPFMTRVTSWTKVEKLKWKIFDEIFLVEKTRPNCARKVR